MFLFTKIVGDILALLFAVHCIHLIEYQQDTIVKLGPEVWLLHVGGWLEQNRTLLSTTDCTHLDDPRDLFDLLLSDDTVSILVIEPENDLEMFYRSLSNKIVFTSRANKKSSLFTLPADFS